MPIDREKLNATLNDLLAELSDVDRMNGAVAAILADEQKMLGDTVTRFVAETYAFSHREHALRSAARMVRCTDHCECGLREQRGIDRVLGHEGGDELVALDRVELVCLAKAHAEEAPGHTVPEGRAAGFVVRAAQLGDGPLGKA